MKHSVEWISQASSEQRTGRGGRTSPGYCYRLYSPSVFTNIFEKFSTPEILRIPLEQVVLTLKSVNIKDVLKFPFPTLPEIPKLIEAIKTLLNLKALK